MNDITNDTEFTPESSEKGQIHADVLQNIPVIALQLDLNYECIQKGPAVCKEKRGA